MNYLFSRQTLVALPMQLRMAQRYPSPASGLSLASVTTALGHSSQTAIISRSSSTTVCFKNLGTRAENGQYCLTSPSPRHRRGQFFFLQVQHCLTLFRPPPDAVIIIGGSVSFGIVIALATGMTLVLTSVLSDSSSDSMFEFPSGQSLTKILRLAISAKAQSSPLRWSYLESTGG